LKTLVCNGFEVISSSLHLILESVVNKSFITDFFISTLSITYGFHIKSFFFHKYITRKSL
jgi:hypothetical protein